jgi:hypothetical protein
LFKFEWGHQIQGLELGVSLGIVVVHPLLDELAHVDQRAKQMCIKQLAAKRAVEALDGGFLGRFAGLNSV